MTYIQHKKYHHFIVFKIKNHCCCCYFFFSPVDDSLSLSWIAFYWINPLTIENKKYPIITIKNKSHNIPIKGFDSTSTFFG